MAEPISSYPKLTVREYVKRQKKVLSEVTYPKLPVRDDSKIPEILPNKANGDRCVSKRDDAKIPLLAQEKEQMDLVETNHISALEPLRTPNESSDEDEAIETEHTSSYNSDEHMMDIQSSDESVLNDENMGSSKGY